MRFSFITASISVVSAMVLPAAMAEQSTSPTFLGCGAMLTFFGTEANCAALYSTSDHMALGIRATTGGVVKDRATAGLGVLSLRPLAGSYWIDVGAGVSRSYDDFYKKYRTGLGAEFRMGNRWTFPFGMTIGLSYAGIQYFGDEYVSFLLVGPEIGWRF